MQASCHSTYDQADLKFKLSRALLHFQDRLLEANIAPGSLCQVWMPETSEEGDQVLKAKGQPYCAAGVVDLLALFRCISCRYCFSTDVSKPELLGAPGRVFTSRQPEMTRNVQQQSKEVYLRAQEALHCRVHSTLVLPLYRHIDRAEVVGILEVIQTTEDMVFGDLVAILSEVLEQCSLYTCDRLQQTGLGKMRPAAAAGAVSATTSKGDNSTHMSASQKASSHGSPNSIRNIGRDSSSPEGVDETSSHLPEIGDHSVRNGNPQLRASLFAQLSQQQLPAAATHQQEVGGLVRGASDAAVALQLAQGPQTGMVTRNSAMQQKAPASMMTRASSFATAGGEASKISSCFDEEEIGSEDGEGWEDDMEDSAEGAGSGDANGRLANRRRGKGTGNPGKPGKKLRLADLQSQFGVGLKEAANKLGICPTTLKRACRRHGIQRWPRRQLARLTRAIDQIRSSGGPEAPPVSAPSGRPLRSSSTALITTPPGSQESAPASSAAAAQSDPGADTRWSALNQLSHTFSAPLDEGSIHGPSRTAALVAAPAYEGSLSPALIHQPSSCPESNGLELSPGLMTAEPEDHNELALPMGLATLQPEDWTHLKEDPWSTSHSDKIGAVSVVAEPDSSHMQLDGDSCCMSLADGMVADEDETVHGAQAFQRHASLGQRCSGLQHLSSGLSCLTNNSLSHRASTGNLFDQGVRIPTSSRALAGLANSHSPHVEEGLLAQSLETHVPHLGAARMPASLPNMAAGNSTFFRTHAGLSMTHLGLGHSHSMASMTNFQSFGSLGESLQAHRDNQSQHDAAAHSLSMQLCSGCPNPFEMTDKEHMTHFGEQATPLQPLGGDELSADMGLMDGDMLEMLLKPE